MIRPVPEAASVEGTISPTSPHGSRESLVLYVPESEEIRVSPVVSRKGYLNILEEKVNGWKKRWVVSIYCILLLLVTILLVIEILFKNFVSLYSEKLHIII